MVKRKTKKVQKKSVNKSAKRVAKTKRKSMKRISPKPKYKTQKKSRKSVKRQSNRKRKSVKRTKRQKGGMGTSFSDLIPDVYGVVKNMVDAMIDSVELMGDVIMIPSDLGTAFYDKSAPGVNNP